jgi:hypothetical protein
MGVTFGLGCLEEGRLLPLETFEFNTSSGRVISFRADFNKRELRCWINRQPPLERNRLRALPRQASYVPFVQTHAKGSVVRINQHPRDPLA